MTEQQEQMIFNEGYRRGKEEEHKWWSFHCAKCTDEDRDVVKCAECIWRDTDNQGEDYCTYAKGLADINDESFCSWGERSDNE